MRIIYTSPDLSSLNDTSKYPGESQESCVYTCACTCIHVHVHVHVCIHVHVYVFVSVQGMRVQWRTHREACAVLSSIPKATSWPRETGQGTSGWHQAVHKVE